MDNNAAKNDDLDRLQKREKELLARVEMLKSSMDRTGEIDTLVFKNKLMKEVQDELRRVQDKLSGLPTEE